MICDCLASERLVGMALLKEGWEEDYAGNPPIHPVGTIGKIVAAEPLPEGRYNIVLEGIDRYQLASEHSEKPYREGDVQIVTHPQEDLLPERLREALIRELGEPGGRWAPHPSVAHFLASRPEDDLLVNTLGFTLPFSISEKQFLLEADARITQAKRLLDLIRFLKMQVEENAR